MYVRIAYVPNAQNLIEQFITLHYRWCQLHAGSGSTGHGLAQLAPWECLQARRVIVAMVTKYCAY
jgi:hypothetical protein